MGGKRYVVTGGGGFVGKAICTALKNQGDSVVSLARGNYPELSELGVEAARVDLGSDPAGWHQLFAGADGVFHTAAKVDMWGKREDFVRANVQATRNVVACCRRHHVQRLVFTSSPSVIHDGTDLLGVDETYPYPKHFDAFYPETKAMAEQEVLAADSPELRTVALRPHLIWGPGDTNLIPTILDRARTGKLVRIGRGDNLVDLCFINDCVNAHLLAMEALHTNASVVGGKAYFISQGDPVSLWGWIDEVLIAHGMPKVQKTISFPLAMRLAAMIEGAARVLLTLGIATPPRLTRFLVSEMATSHYFSIEKAKRELGFEPSCSIAAAMQRTFRAAA